MSALCKIVRRQACRTNLIFTAIPKRFLRVDPEEEIERLHITESFDKRMRPLLLSESQSFRNIIGRETTTVVVQESPSDDLDSSQTMAKGSEPLSGADSSPFGLCPIPIEAVNQDDYIYERNSFQAIEALHHYNIFADVFNDNLMFTPDHGVCFKVAYSLDSDDVLPVFQGNKIDPHLGAECPLVGFSGHPEKLYSLLFLNLDGHLSETSAEYLHWSCVNMRGDEGVISGSSTEYLQPIPIRGTGFHRYVFLLIEHDAEIDSTHIPEVVANDLSSRTFHFSQFYSKIADKGATPVAIHFFQSEWDPSVRQAFHQVLDMPEPACQYDYPQRKIPKQVKYAHREPFQKYLDMYRDKKEVAEEVLKEHISETSPYLPLEAQKLPYPLATPTKPGLYKDQLPATWIQDNMKHKVNKTYKYTYIYKSD